MRIEEAREIVAILSGMDMKSGTTCLNIGSSTRQFREVDKPHIRSELIQPLEQLGVEFVHIDIKSGKGVDLVGDVLDPDFRGQLRALDSKLLLCCNLLEHLSDPDEFAASCGDLVRADGLMIVSVPFSFPRHEDPIDNMLRPSPEEIGYMFPGWGLRAGKIVRSGSYLADSFSRKNGLTMLIKSIGAVLFPFLSKGRWRPRAHRLLWLFRPYKISIAVLERQST